MVEQDKGQKSLISHLYRPAQDNISDCVDSRTSMPGPWVVSMIPLLSGIISNPC